MGCRWLQRKIRQLKQPKFDDEHIYEEIDDFRLQALESVRRQHVTEPLTKDTYGKHVVPKDTEANVWAKSGRYGSQDNLYIPMEGTKQRHTFAGEHACKTCTCVKCETRFCDDLKTPMPEFSPPKSSTPSLNLKASRVSEGVCAEQCYGSFIDSLFFNDDDRLGYNSCNIPYGTGKARNFLVIPSCNLFKSQCICSRAHDPYTTFVRENTPELCFITRTCAAESGCCSHNSCSVPSGSDLSCRPCPKVAGKGHLCCDKISGDRRVNTEYNGSSREHLRLANNSELELRHKCSDDVLYVNTTQKVRPENADSKRTKIVSEDKAQCNLLVTQQKCCFRKEENATLKNLKTKCKRQLKYNSDVDRRKDSNRVLYDLILHNNSQLL